MGWGTDPNDNDPGRTPAWESDPSHPIPPPEPQQRDPQMRRNPQLGRDPQWGRDPQRDSLRPLNLGDVLDGMFKLARTHWKAFLVGLSVIVVPLSLLSGLVVAQLFGTGPGLLESLQDPGAIESGVATPDPAELVRFAVAGALSGLASLLLTPLIYGVAVRVAATGYRAGAVEPMESVRAAAGRYPALLGALFLAYVLVIGIAVSPAILVGIGAAAGSTALQVIGGIAFVASLVVAVIALVRLSLIVPAVVVERAGAATSLRRSNELVKGSTGIVFGTLLVVGIVVAVIGVVLTLPFQLGVLGGGRLAAVVTTAGSIISSLVSNTLTGAALVLVYFDRRVRAEGYDLSELASELGDTPDPRW